jgi:hypothetical protein
MLPTNSEIAKKYGCSPTSSNCVVWQGPDIECISLCKGDTITDVVYKLATELCIIMEQFNLNNYDLSCLRSDSTLTINNLQDLIQLLLTRQCSILEGNSDGSPITISNDVCPTNCIVPIAKCFEFTNSQGDLENSMPLLDYINAIGNRVCSIVDTLNTTNNSLINTRSLLDSTNKNIEILDNQKASKTSLQYQLNIKTDGLSETLFVTDALRKVENETIKSKEALGTIENVFDAIVTEGTIPEEDQLSSQGKVKNILGYIFKPKNISESLTNLWLNISDLRKSVKFILDNWDRNSCNSLFLNFQTQLSGTRIKLYVNGSTGFTSDWEEIGNKTEIIIKDKDGNVTTTSFTLFSYLSDPSGFTIDLAPTPIDITKDIEVILVTKFRNKVSNTTCEKEYKDVIYSEVVCPSVTFSVSSDSINYQFNSTKGFTYKLNLYYSGSTNVLETQIITSPPPSVNNSFMNLKENTDYELELIVVNCLNQETVCDKNYFKTLTSPCLPVINVTATLTY